MIKIANFLLIMIPLKYLDNKTVSFSSKKNMKPPIFTSLKIFARTQLIFPNFRLKFSMKIILPVYRYSSSLNNINNKKLRKRVMMKIFSSKKLKNKKNNNSSNSSSNKICKYNNNL